MMNCCCFLQAVDLVLMIDELLFHLLSIDALELVLHRATPLIANGMSASEVDE